jgi:hypothetical protein
MARRTDRKPRSGRKTIAAISLPVTGWRKVALTELAAASGLSLQDIVAELVDSALCGSVSLLRELTEQKEGEDCGGECTGTGQQATTTRDETCPGDCTTNQEMQDLIEEAKARARRDAIRKCLKINPDCVCEGGTYTELEKYCKTWPAKPPLPIICHRVVRYRYTGACKNDP